MVLNISEFNPNCITAVMDDPLDDLTLCRCAILGYEGFPEVPQLVIYRGIRLARNYLEIDIKDDETKEFFKSLIECLLRVRGYSLVSPLINYGGCYMLRCKADLQGKLKLDRYCRGYCEIKIVKEFDYSNSWLPYTSICGVPLVIKNVKLC